MLVYLIIGLYCYIAVKTILSFKFKLLNELGYKIFDLLFIVIILAFVYSDLNKSSISDTLITSRELFSLAFILLLIILGVSSGINFITYKFNNHFEEDNKNIKDYFHPFTLYSQSSILISLFILNFLLSLLEISSSSRNNLSFYISVLNSSSGIVLGILFAFFCIKSHKITLRIVVGLSLIFNILWLITAYDGTLMWEFGTLPVTSAFGAFSFSTIVSYILNSIYFFIKKLFDKKILSFSNVSPKYQKDEEIKKVIENKEMLTGDMQKDKLTNLIQRDKKTYETYKPANNNSEVKSDSDKPAFISLSDLNK